MAVYLSSQAKLKLCKLIADRMRSGNLKIYATLGRVGLKGPAFYAYVEGRSMPSDEIMPRIVTLAIALDRDRAVEIMREDLNRLTGFIDRILGFASASLSTADQIFKELLGPTRERTRKNA